MPRSAPSLRSLLDSGKIRLGEGHSPARTRKGKEGAFFGLPALDSLTPEGIGRSLHAFESADGTSDPAAAGFVVSFLFNICSNERQPKPMLWIGQALSRTEGGRPYGPGLADMALDPARLLTVDVRTPVDALWAAEEGLASGAVTAVICELNDSAGRLDLTATRRLALRSEAAGVPAYLVTSGASSVQGTAARTRWRIASAPSLTPSLPHLLGAPVWDVELLKNRDGPCGRRRIGFCPRKRRYFDPAPAPATERPTADRPPAAAGARVVDFPLRPDLAEPFAAP